MNPRLAGVALALSALLLASFARLAADPSSLLVDADHPSLDHARHFDDPSPGNDLTRLFLPHHLAISRAIARDGHLPTWDERGFGGRPLVGNPQGGLFYPPTWLAWRPGAPSALGWLTVAHLLFAGFGTLRLARTLGLGGWASLVAAGCFQCCPYVFAQTFEGHYPHVWAACWYPWAFEAAARLRRGERRAIPALALILAMATLAGHPQEVYYLLIALGAWAIFDGLIAIRQGRGREAVGAGFAWAAVLALASGLAAVELVPDVLAQGWTLRVASQSLRLAGRYHLYPANFLQILGPGALGGPADYFGHENYWESVTSIGLIPLALGAVALAWSPDRRGVRGWLALIVASLVFASGRKLGLFALLYDLVPGMDRFRVPARALFLASLGASMLAGLGVDALRALWADDVAWRRLARRFALIAAVLSSLVLAGSWLADGRGWASAHRSAVTLRDRVEGRRLRPRGSEFDRMLSGLARLSGEPIFWLALGSLPLGLAIGRSRPGARRGVAVALGLLGLVELGAYGHALIRTSPASRFLGPDPIGEALARARPVDLGPPRIRAVDALYDDLRAETAGVSKTNVNDSFQIQHAADLYEWLYRLFEGDRPDRRHPDLSPDARREVRQSVLDRMAVSLIVSDRPGVEGPWTPVESGSWDGSTYAIFRNPTAVPRAYVVPRAEVAPEDFLIEDRFRSTDPRQAVLMADDPLANVPGRRQPFTKAAWASADPGRIVVDVTTEAPGLLVIADTWMPGWTALVDGNDAPVLRGNQAQRVVPLPDPGRHKVVLRYRPPGLGLGLVVTIVSLFVSIGLLLDLARISKIFSKISTVKYLE